MRPASLLASLLAPALAAAQATPTVGGVTFSDPWLNAAQCSGTDTTSDIQLSWTVALGSGVTIPSGSTFQVYASMSAFPTPSTTTASQNCASTAGAILVGDPIATSQASATNQSFTKSEIAAARAASCAPADDVTVYVCVQLSSSGTPSVGNALAIATGSLTLSTRPPSAPTIDSVASGDEALHVDWSPPSGTPAAVEYRVLAQSTTDTTRADPTTAPDARDLNAHSVAGIEATSYRLDGLVNGVTYAVTVHATSAAGNEGVGSPWAFETPHHVADYWEYYKDLGGTEQGGCTAGGTGALALLGAAALLAARRRK